MAMCANYVEHQHLSFPQSLFETATMIAQSSLKHVDSVICLYAFILVHVLCNSSLSIQET